MAFPGEKTDQGRWRELGHGLLEQTPLREIGTFIKFCPPRLVVLINLHKDHPNSQRENIQILHCS